MSKKIKSVSLSRTSSRIIYPIATVYRDGDDIVNKRPSSYSVVSLLRERRVISLMTAVYNRSIREYMAPHPEGKAGLVTVFAGCRK